MEQTALTSLISDIESAGRLVIEREKEYEMLLSRLQDIQHGLSEAKDKSRMLGDSVKLMQIFSGSIRSGVILKFEELMTNAIREIYGRDYSIKIEFEFTKGGGVWADIYVILPSGKRINISKEGGGLKDVVSVLARILYLMMDPSQPAKLLIFDENIKNLDEWRSPEGIRLIFKVINELGIQSIFITHKEAISSGKVELPGAKIFRLRLEDEKSVCEEVPATGN